MRSAAIRPHRTPTPRFRPDARPELCTQICSTHPLAYQKQTPGGYINLQKHSFFSGFVLGGGVFVSHVFVRCLDRQQPAIWMDDPGAPRNHFPGK